MPNYFEENNVTHQIIIRQFYMTFGQYEDLALI